MKDHHKLRAWDGESYWYLKDDGVFWQDGHDRNMVAHTVIPKMEIELCSGLKNKDGNLTFEGDLYIFENDDGVYPIIFRDGEFCFDFGESYFSLETLEGDLETAYHVGNIHQNPELLEKS